MNDDDSRAAALLGRFPPGAQVPAGLEHLRDEMRATLRIPYTGALTDCLAHDPDVLRTLWASVREALGTVRAERRADSLRSYALITMPASELGARHRTALARAGIGHEALGEIRALQDSVHYGLPKLLLMAALWSRALAGKEPVAPRPEQPDDLAALPSGIAPGAVRPEPVALDTAPAALRRTLEGLRDDHGFPFVPGYYLALARWPAYVEQARVHVRLIVGSPRYHAAAEWLATYAEVAARDLGVSASPAARAGRVIGREDAAAVVGLFHRRVLPELLLDCAFLRALLVAPGQARTNSLSLTG